MGSLAVRVWMLLILKWFGAGKENMSGGEALGVVSLVPSLSLSMVLQYMHIE